MEHDIRDIVLYQNSTKDICRAHTHTRRRWRTSSSLNGKCIIVKEADSDKTQESR
jgi:hypothetical protein